MKIARRAAAALVVLLLAASPAMANDTLPEGSVYQPALIGYWNGTLINGSYSCTNTFFTVNWGDGVSTNNGQVVQNVSQPTSNCSGTLFSTTQLGGRPAHVYQSPGTYVVSVSNNYDGTTVAEPHVDVTQAALTAEPTSETISLDAATSPVIAGFASAWLDEPASHFTASVNWGDGTPEATGTVTVGTRGHFLVSAPPHTYATAGSYAVTVSIAQPFYATPLTIQSSVVVTNPVLTADPQPFTRTVGAPAPAIVARFTSAWAAEPLGHFAATVDWGDGTAPVVASITADGGGRFSVNAPEHIYGTAGSYTVTATVTRPASGSSLKIASTATVSPPPAPAPTPTLQQAVDTVPPVVTHLKTLLKYKIVGKHRIARRVLTFTSSERGTTSVHFQRRSSHGRWVALKLALPKTQTAAGRNTLYVPTTLQRRITVPGRYRAVIAVTDDAGNRSSLRSVVFVVR